VKPYLPCRQEANEREKRLNGEGLMALESGSTRSGEL